MANRKTTLKNLLHRIGVCFQKLVRDDQLFFISIYFVNYLVDSNISCIFAF
jgi:hypothetical protein